MSEPLAEQLSDIAKRLKEIEEERRKERQAAIPPEVPEVDPKRSYGLWR